MNVLAHTELEKQKQNKPFTRSGLRNTALMYDGQFFCLFILWPIIDF